jgi:hypothetical protein
MNECGAANRLVSYYEMLNKPDAPLQNYIIHGIDNLDYKRRAPAPVWDDRYTSHRRMTLLKRLQQEPPDGTPSTD